MLHWAKPLNKESRSQGRAPRGCDRPRPTQGLLGPSGPEPRKLCGAGLIATQRPGPIVAEWGKESFQMQHGHSLVVPTPKAPHIWGFRSSYSEALTILTKSTRSENLGIWDFRLVGLRKWRSMRCCFVLQLWPAVVGCEFPRCSLRKRIRKNVREKLYAFLREKLKGNN